MKKQLLIKAIIFGAEVWALSTIVAVFGLWRESEGSLSPFLVNAIEGLNFTKSNIFEIIGHSFEFVWGLIMSLFDGSIFKLNTVWKALPFVGVGFLFFRTRDYIIKKIGAGTLRTVKKVFTRPEVHYINFYKDELKKAILKLEREARVWENVEIESKEIIYKYFTNNPKLKTFPNFKGSTFQIHKNLIPVSKPLLEEIWKATGKPTGKVKIKIIKEA